MEINKEMENDIKFLLDAVEEFQNKYIKSLENDRHTVTCMGTDVMQAARDTIYSLFF